MEEKLDALIAKIKSEGLAKAENEADKIKTDARAEADKLIKNAQSEAAKIKEEAQQEAARMQASGESALQNSARDLILAVRKKLESVFQEIIKEEMNARMREQVLLSAIDKLFQSWDGKAEDFKLELSEEDSKAILSALQAKLADKLKAGLEIKAVEDLESGFKVSIKDGSAYYDFTDEALSEVLSRFLNPRFSALIKNAGE